MNIPRSTLIILGILWLLLAVALIVVQLVIPPAVKLEWKTETEFDTAGFNVLRSDFEDGEYSKINQQMIPSTADPSSGAVYQYVDREVAPGKTYYYRLQDVEFDSSIGTHEIITAQAPTSNWWLALLAISCAVAGVGLVVTGLKSSSG